LQWTDVPGEFSEGWQIATVPTGYNVNSYGDLVLQGPLQANSSNSGKARFGPRVQYSPPSSAMLYKAAYDTNSVIVLDPSATTLAATIPVGTHPRGLAGTPDGKQVWVANMGSGTISVISTSTLKVTGTITLPPSQPYGIAITPDGTSAYVANGSTSGAVYVINVAKQSLTATIKVGSAPFKLAVSPDGAQVYVANNNDGTVSVVDVLTNTVIKTITLAIPAIGVAFEPNGTRAYVTANDSLYVIDPSSYQVLATVPVGVYPVNVTVNPAGTEAFVCNRDSPFISHINLMTNQWIENIQVGFGTETVAFVPLN
jgi:YVTN family beta-propeller protein